MTKIFFLIFIVIGIGVCFLGFSNLKKSLDTKNWPKTTGKVISSAVDSFQPSGRTSSGKRLSPAYLAKVQYQYSVNGKTYTSDKISFAEYATSENISIGKYSKSGSGHAREVADKYRPGQEVIVYYDSGNPAVAILEPGAMGGVFITFIAGVLFILFGGLFYYFANSS